jgi:two-component system chemotaxis response regulator CheY
LKILVVDDSSVMRRIVQRTLRQAGFADQDIDEAESGAQALEKIEAARPDLVLSDWNLPGMTGIELLEKLRRKAIDVDFVFVVSESTGAMRSRADAAGAKAFLSRPFSTDSLQAALGDLFD